MSCLELDAYTSSLIMNAPYSEMMVVIKNHMWFIWISSMMSSRLHNCSC